jgi:hypothetical protein
VRQQSAGAARVELVIQAPEGVRASDFELDLAGSDLIVGPTHASER